jgi:hypothetical protein
MGLCKTLDIALIVLFLSCGNDQPCDSVAKEFRTYENAIDVVKAARFIFTDSVNTSNSSWIRGAWYYSCDSKAGYFIIKTDSRNYIHDKVPISVWQGFKNAESFGSFYNSNIRGKFRLDLPKFVDTSMVMSQSELHNILLSFDSGTVNAPNKSQKTLLKDNPESYLINIIPSSLGDFKVKTLEISHEKRKDGISLYAYFSDDKVMYIGYASFNDEREMLNDATYKFIKGFKENSDTVISFMFTMQASINKKKEYFLRVIPQPKTGIDYPGSAFGELQGVDVINWFKKLPN